MTRIIVPLPPILVSTMCDMPRTSRVSKATLPGYYQLGDESNGYVIPESCIKSQIQVDIISNCQERSIEIASPRNYTPRSIAETGADLSYYYLIFLGKYQAQIHTDFAGVDQEEWTNKLDYEIRNIWVSKGCPIPEFKTTISPITVGEGVIYVINIYFTLSENEKSLISQCIKTPIDTPHYIVGKIKVNDGIIEYLKKTQKE